MCLLTTTGCGQMSKKKEGREIVKKSLDTLAVVQDVNRYRLKLDSLEPNLDSLVRDVYDESAEGGTVKVFFKESDTLKKEIVYYGETGKRLLEVYQKEGNPILIEDTNVKYQEPIYSSNDISIKSKVNNTYYLNSKSDLIYWIKNDKVMSPSLYLNQSKQIIKE